jgi:hypothetical protein
VHITNGDPVERLSGEEAGCRTERLKMRDIAFLIAGIGISSEVGLLLAPSSGEQLRYALAGAAADRQKT